MKLCETTRLSCVCAAAQGSEAVMALLSTADGISRVHASRRFFDLLQEHDIDIPVIHQRVFTAGDTAQLAIAVIPLPTQHPVGTGTEQCSF